VYKRQAWRRHARWLILWPAVFALAIVGINLWLFSLRQPVSAAIAGNLGTFVLAFIFGFAFIALWMALWISYLASRRGPDERRYVVEQVRALLAAP